MYVCMHVCVRMYACMVFQHDEIILYSSEIYVYIYIIISDKIRSLRKTKRYIYLYLYRLYVTGTTNKSYSQTTRLFLAPHLKNKMYSQPGYNFQYNI